MGIKPAERVGRLASTEMLGLQNRKERTAKRLILPRIAQV